MQNLLKNSLRKLYLVRNYFYKCSYILILILLREDELKYVLVIDVEIDRMELSTQLPNNEYITNTTLPECNREAINVNDIYNIYDIIPENKLENLYNNVKEILNNNSNTLEEYVCFKNYYFFNIINFIK